MLPKLTLLGRSASALGIALLAYWLLAYEGGMGFRPVDLGGGKNSTQRVLNLHPLLMTAAFGVLAAEAVLAYGKAWPQSLLRTQPRQKALHAALNTAATAAALAGLASVYLSKHLKRPERFHHLYSAHSMAGLITAALLITQWTAGFAMYLLPVAPTELRARAQPIHLTLGLLTLGAATSAILSGLMDYQSIALQRDIVEGGGSVDPDSWHLWLPKVIGGLLASSLLGTLLHHARGDLPLGREPGGTGLQEQEDVATTSAAAAVRRGAAAEPPAAAGFSGGAGEAGAGGAAAAPAPVLSVPGSTFDRIMNLARTGRVRVTATLPAAAATAAGQEPGSKAEGVSLEPAGVAGGTQTIAGGKVPPGAEVGREAEPASSASGAKKGQ